MVHSGRLVHTQPFRKKCKSTRVKHSFSYVKPQFKKKKKIHEGMYTVVYM